MWQAAVLYIVVLFASLLADGQSTCDSDAPYNCTFESGLQLCNWTFSKGLTYDRSSAVFGTDDSSVETATSRTACSTGGETHCLKICHSFEGDNNTGLNVFFIDEDGHLVCGSADRALNVSHEMYLNVTNRNNFQVILEARRDRKGNGKLFIKNITYSKAPCSVLKTTTSTSSLDTQVCTYATTENNNSHETAGAVVGVVVSVIIVGIAVVIFILYRRKQLHMWKTCFINANKKDTTGTSQNGQCYVGKDRKRAANGVNTTPTVSGYNNHAFTASESQPSDTYYSVTKDTDESGAPYYSTIQESQSADGKILTNSSKCTDNDPYEIEAENGHLTSKSTATRHTNANENLKGKTGLNVNLLPPAFNRDNRQAQSDYSLARGTGGEATGVYHCLEENPNNHGEEESTELYHYAKDPDMNPEADTDATRVYHILAEDPALSDYQSHHEPKAGKAGQLHTPAVKVFNGQTGNYNTLDFVGKSSGQMENEDSSGGVYNHLNAGNDDPYNEVDREKRAEVIDGEYAHIK